MGAACYETWRTLVKKVGGTPDGWRDLGYFLGIPQDDLNVSRIFLTTRIMKERKKQEIYLLSKVPCAIKLTR